MVKLEQTEAIHQEVANQYVDLSAKALENMEILKSSGNLIKLKTSKINVLIAFAGILTNNIIMLALMISIFVFIFQS